jgi:hypothetical protein
MLKSIKTSTQLRNLNCKIELINSVSVKKDLKVDIIIQSHFNFLFWVEIYLVLLIEGEEHNIKEFEDIIL